MGTMAEGQCDNTTREKENAMKNMWLASGEWLCCWLPRLRCPCGPRM